MTEMERRAEQVAQQEARIAEGRAYVEKQRPEIRVWVTEQLLKAVDAGRRHRAQNP